METDWKILTKIFASLRGLIAYMDTDFNYVKVNRAFALAHGHFEADFCARNHFEMFPKDNRKSVFENVLKTGLPHIAYEEPFTFGFKDAKERYWDWTAQPVYGDGEAALGLILTMDDVSERRHTRHALERSETQRAEITVQRDRAEKELLRLSAAMEQAAEGVVITDTRGIIHYTNVSFRERTGFEAEELLGSHIQVYERETTGRTFRKRWESITGGDIWRGRVTRRKKNGDTYEAEMTITPLREEPDGEITELVSIERDVTREVRLEKQLQQVQKMEALGTLTGGIAHDLNNILMPIILNAELLLEDFEEDDDDTSPLLEKILGAAKRGRELVKQVVTFSRRTDEDRAPLSIASVVKEALALVRASLPANTELSTFIDISPGIVIANPVNIHQIILNLCGNAAHAIGPEGGKIEVRLENELCADRNLSDGLFGPTLYARLTVTDSGCGIPNEVRRRIFDPFFTTKPPGEGSGMGLAVVHGIVETHCGTIDVTSEPGRGTSFVVRLPQATEAAEEEDPPAVTRSNRVGEILLVEDNSSVAESVMKVLERLGHRVSLATGVVEAGDLIEQRIENIDLVLSDQTMRDGLGSRLAAATARNHPELPFLLYSGHAASIPKKDVEGANIRGVLYKPLDTEELRTAVARALAG